MKKKTYILSLSHAVMALAVVGSMFSCADDAGLIDIFKSGDSNGLSVAPVVSEPTVVTRAASDVTLKEEQLNTLDVFVEAVDNPGSFLKQYHLVAPTNEIGHQVQSLLADNWRAEGLELGKYYNIYVATNNPKTTSDVANVDALKALTYDEVSDGVAVINADNNNVTWGATTTSGNIYKLYDANPGDFRALTSDKQFMMDGILKNWTPDANTRDQIFQPVTLNRAAAKIVLNVDFDADFLKSLTQEKKTVDGVETWVDKPDAQKVTITGSPAWRFCNFAFGAPVFAPETQGDPIEVHNSDFNIFHNQSCAGGAEFQIITYTYPTKWAAADYATAAPSLVISIGFTENGETTYHYYRIPLVASTTTAIERNHIYVVNATIATRGSELYEDEDEIENVYYNVLPWNDETNSQAIHNEVQSVQHYYFNVNPKVYTLRGDGDQSVVLNYSKASGTKVNWSLFTYDAQGNETAVVANNATNAIRAWYYDADGDFMTTYSDNSGVNWSNTGSTPMGVSIVQSGEGTSGSTGTVTVTSTALNNRAIKYIRLRVYLDEPSTFDDDGNPTMYEDIIIRHFPTDNIQNIEGLWSSYHDPNAASSTTIYKTTSLAEAQSLAEQYGISYSSEEFEETEYINYTTYSAHAGEAGYAMVGPQAITREQFAAAVTSNTNRQNANSQANARLVDQWYYWGVNPSQTNNQGQSDYYTTTWGILTTYYAYANRYRAQYTHVYSYTEYTLELPIASTGNWVNWAADDRANHPSQRVNQINYTNNGSQFRAKVYNNGTIYYINESQRNGGGYQTTQGNASSLTNNHMYVIQISSTSDDYVLGRPYVNTTTHQSQDDVVSPAFMIASQLGAVTEFPANNNNSPTNAATHCSRYMEVTPDGTYYTGWRLPTPAEISVITGYQYGNINGITIPNDYRAMTPVLTGRYYWSLSGERILTRQQNDNGSFLRCVRDLSAAEVEALNGFDAIVEKYRN